MDNKQRHYAPGMRVVVRDEEWVIRRADDSADGGHLLTCEGISELVRGREGRFLTQLEQQIDILDPAGTRLVEDDSPNYQAAWLYLESQLRRRLPTDARVRNRIPTNHTPFHYYDKAIISIDTLKQDVEYRHHLENAYLDIVVIDALATQVLGLTREELLTIYRVHFPVMRQNKTDTDTWYDHNDCIVCTPSKGLVGVEQKIPARRRLLRHQISRTNGTECRSNICKPKPALAPKPGKTTPFPVA